MKIRTTKEAAVTSYEALKAECGFTNPMQAPKLGKVIVTIRIGSISDKKRRELILDRLTRITGQKPAITKSKKSIATFKTRVGDLAGYRVTLRGARMYSFLDKLVHIALPRTRDFRGIEQSVVDSMGNMSFGIKEHTVFPETADEDIKDVFGFGITIVSSAKNAKDALAFYRLIGIPFKK